jgi:hypothetical protein
MFFCFFTIIKQIDIFLFFYFSRDMLWSKRTYQFQWFFNLCTYRGITQQFTRNFVSLVVSPEHLSQIFSYLVITFHMQNEHRSKNWYIFIFLFFKGYAMVFRSCRLWSHQMFHSQFWGQGLKQVIKTLCSDHFLLFAFSYPHNKVVGWYTGFTIISVIF